MAKTQTFMARTDQTFLSMFWQHISQIHPHLCSACLWRLQSPLRLSSFQGYRKSLAVNVDCLMTDARGTKRALITFLTVGRFQQTSGNTQRQMKGNGDDSILRPLQKLQGIFFYYFLQSLKQGCSWRNIKRSVACEFTGKLQCLQKEQSQWLLVEGLHSLYSRNIWCELAVIVDFRRTTVCLVKGEQWCLKEWETFKRSFLLCATFLKLASLLANEWNMSLSLFNEAVTEDFYASTSCMCPHEE